MKAFVLIKTSIGETVEIVKKIRQVTGVTVVDVTFGPYDAIAIVETDDEQNPGPLVIQKIHNTPRVIETLTCVVVET